MLELIEDLGMKYATEKSNYKSRFALYKCSCGNEFETQVCSVKRGHTKSCGCYKKQKHLEVFETHGLGKHKLYSIWNSMMGRCLNENNKDYKHYGARGITVCESWQNPKNFIDDMYPSYQQGLSIDRENNNKGYSPDNCRWANVNTQRRNTRKIISTNTSRYRGVSWSKRDKKWLSIIGVNSKNKYIGYFDNKIEAAKAYDQYIIDNNLEHTKNFN